MRIAVVDWDTYKKPPYHKTGSVLQALTHKTCPQLHAIQAHATHRDVFVPTLHTELPGWACFTTHAGALVATRQLTGASLITRQPAAWGSTRQNTLPLRNTSNILVPGY